MSLASYRVGVIGGVALVASFIGTGLAYSIYQRRKTHDANQQSTPPSTTTSSSSSSSSTLLTGVSSSSSSKVLLTGGYLILESEYSGLVIALSARFHTECYAITKEQYHALGIDSTSFPSDSSSIPVIVYAPQRSSRPLRYSLSWSTTGEQFTLAKGNEEQETNKFVELSILYTLLFVAGSTSLSSVLSSLGSGLLFYLEGDFPFYSAVPPTSSSESNGIPPVVPDGSKTGLGSSAALVVSLVAALVQQLNANTLPTHAIHNLAQLIHCAAQGKVGSGFDVSTAFYGSQIYHRFDRDLIQDLVDLAGSSKSSSTVIPSQRLTDCVSPNWHNRVEQFQLPPGLRVMLADVAGGASTPTMVKMVLKWRENKEESTPLWSRLSAANSVISNLFAELSSLAASDPVLYNDIRMKLARHPACKWDLIDATPVGKVFQKLSSSFYNVRHLLRQLGAVTGADIEPVEQGKLLNETVLLNGVLMAGVPGAGGDDAIFAIVLDESIEPAVEDAWSKHQFDDPKRLVRRLPVGEAKEQILTQKCQKDISKWSFQ